MAGQYGETLTATFGTATVDKRYSEMLEKVLAYWMEFPGDMRLQISKMVTTLKHPLPEKRLSRLVVMSHLLTFAYSIHHTAPAIPTVLSIPIIGVAGDGDDTDNDTDDNCIEGESEDDDSDDMSAIGIDKEEIQVIYVDAWDLESPLFTNSPIIESVGAPLTLEDHERKSYDLYGWVEENNVSRTGYNSLLLMLNKWIVDDEFGKH
ncbi:hypothetical protein INT45_012359 [Circinella minor]|uniref:Uncharacterized protein n=1 Tax=Circinella minor TaxID=1195481 RepID=A0A8H7S1F3_9FUNG|nr:hypothetical protein INT45_012359 [Circinella minor]